MADGPMGATCPTCGLFLHVHGCAAAICKNPETRAHVIGEQREKFVDGTVGPESAPFIASRGEIGSPAAVEHPAPWRWVDGHWDVDALIDANRRPLIDASSSTGTIHIKDKRVRALTEAAPEMEALLREEVSGTVCILVDRAAVGRRDIKPDEMCPPGQECWWCRARALLAGIDAAGR